MNVGFILFGFALIFAVLYDTFATIILPRSVDRDRRLTNYFYLAVGRVWRWVAKRLPYGSQGRTEWLGAFGPLSVILLVALWAVLLIVGFALVHFGANTLKGADFFTTFYFSGTTFLTIGFGDMTSTTTLGRTLSIVEGGTGFGFLAIVLGYIPVLYQSFSRREHLVLLLDARAGSNPSAGEIWRRYSEAGALDDLCDFLKEWELWSAQQLETYLSYPIVAFYRSQHDDQSWVTAITCILDLCTLIQDCVVPVDPWSKKLRFQAANTFAMARHMIVDLAYILSIPPQSQPFDRLTPERKRTLERIMRGSGVMLKEEVDWSFSKQRDLYEPYAIGLAKTMFCVLPDWTSYDEAQDHWQVTAWDNPHFRAGN